MLAPSQFYSSIQILFIDNLCLYSIPYLNTFQNRKILISFPIVFNIYLLFMNFIFTSSELYIKTSAHFVPSSQYVLLHTSNIPCRPKIIPYFRFIRIQMSKEKLEITVTSITNINNCQFSKSHHSFLFTSPHFSMP